MSGLLCFFCIKIRIQEKKEVETPTIDWFCQACPGTQNINKIFRGTPKLSDEI